MNKKKVIIPIVASILTLGILTGVSYAYFNAKITENNKTETVIKSNELGLTFTGVSEINASSMIPGDSFTKTFSVENTSNRAVTYNIYMQNITNEFNEDLVYTLTDDNGDIVSETALPETNIGKTYLKLNISINSGVTKNYTLKIEYKYLDTPQNDYQGSSFNAILGIDSEQLVYSEAILNGADPVLKDNLVPVNIADDGTVTKANIEEEWYNYENKRWANAVILVDDGITYSSNDVIPESNIESYFVWIPKYSYEIFNLGTTDGYIEENPTTSIAKPINIKFGLTNTKDSNTNECTTPMTSGASGNCSVGDYMTHPAFISMNANGLWVAKFETTGDISNLTVKPGVKQIKNQTVKSMFEAAYNYQRDNDSHMMKNTEWGAVAYLSHSKYGINAEVRINNYSALSTGYASTDSADQSSFPATSGTSSDVTLPYNTTTGYKASTTGNITGVYDMSGGVWEYMASYLKDTYGSSGFDSTTIANYNIKYYDEYELTNSSSNYSKRILGDATGEMGPFYYYADKDGTKRQHNNWYNDFSNVITSPSPWVHRSGYNSNGVLGGQFSFVSSTGAQNASIGFRIVLVN